MDNNNQKLVPEAENGLDKMKYEIANEEGINLKRGYNGDITAKEAGKIGGNMVRKMIEYAEKNMSKLQKNTQLIINRKFIRAKRNPVLQISLSPYFIYLKHDFGYNLYMLLSDYFSRFIYFLKCHEK